MTVPQTDAAKMRERSSYVGAEPTRRSPLAARWRVIVVVVLTAACLVGVGVAVAMRQPEGAVVVLASIAYDGPYQITTGGDFYGIEGNAIVRKGTNADVDAAQTGGGGRRIDFDRAPCRTERQDGRRSLASNADAILVSASDDRVIVFGTRSSDRGERHVSVGCVGHLDTGETQSIEDAMPDLARLLKTHAGVSLHFRAGNGGRWYAWSAEVPLTVFNGSGASSRLLAGEKSGASSQGACTLVDGGRLVVACAYPSGEPGQAELRISAFSDAWPPVRTSYDVLPVSIDALSDFALSDDGRAIATWGSRRGTNGGASDSIFDSHVALTKLESKELVLDTHWRSDQPVRSAHFDPEGHGIFVVESSAMDSSSSSSLRFVPVGAWKLMAPVMLPGQVDIATGGPHRMWLLDGRRALAIAEPRIEAAEQPNEPSK